MKITKQFIESSISDLDQRLAMVTKLNILAGMGRFPELEESTIGVVINACLDVAVAEEGLMP
jgi:hypothetical protein